METNIHNRPIGACRDADGKTTFSVWAPRADKIELLIVNPEKKTIPMDRGEFGYWETAVEHTPEPLDYYYRIDGDRNRPDPASHFQPEGVQRESRVVDHDTFDWHDKDWQGIPLDKMIIYELHTGTFTQEGTFDSALHKIRYLKDLGINTIGLMPVAQFPGTRNWGYDGVHPYAVQNSYGGPDKLKALINAAHEAGLAVVLDVVYNHLGPEGNYLGEFAPYFTDHYKTPWGSAINFDRHDSDGVRNYFIRNALYWFDKYHIDALRLDAIHGIYDFSAKPFLEELSERVEEFSEKIGRPRYLIAETNQNDRSIISSRDENGLGMHSQWSDDFHHALHTVLTGENDGYYMDYGKVEDLDKAIREGYVYDWRYSPFRKRRYGSSSENIPGERFVISTQTHDQVGNRLGGDRLSGLVPFEALKPAAVAMLTAPYVPMLFMGEEYAETAPFLYFISHLDKDLVEAVRKGRKEEFAEFEWGEDPPDPQSEETFHRSQLQWELLDKKKHKAIFELYRYLIKLRKEHPSLTACNKENLQAKFDEDRKIIAFSRKDKEETINVILALSGKQDDSGGFDEFIEGTVLMDTSDEKWAGNGSNLSDKVNRGEMIKLNGYHALIFKREKS